MPRTTAVLLLGSALLAAPVSAATTNDAATECRYDALRLQQQAAPPGRQAEGGTDRERLLSEAIDRAEEGDVGGCRAALQGVKGQGGAAPRDAGTGGAPASDRDIAPANRPAASSGLKTGSESPSAEPSTPSQQNNVRSEVGALVQKAGLTQIEGTEVVGSNHEPIGEVEAVAQTKAGQQTFLVVGVGGFLGIGERRIARPLSEFQAGDGNFVLAGADRPSIEDMPEYDEAQYRKVSLPDVLKPLPDERPGTRQDPPVTR